MNDVAGDAADRAPIAGSRVLIAAHGLALAAPLARGLERLGAKVACLDANCASRGEWDDAVQAATRDLGGLDLVVHAAAPAAAIRPADLDGLSLDEWQRATAGGLHATLCCLQAALPLLHSGGGTIVVLGPSASLIGVPGLVPLITLAEAQRTLVKSSARQWGVHGIRLHWLGLAATHYSEALRDARIPSVPELGPPPPALGRVPDIETDAAELIALLAGPGARGLTGATFNLDGGDWMVP
jgi:NAD(P)-dependent dehydrogenase (short-subunit alcohol dehydrogenase family)